MNHDRNVISLEARRREKERAAEVYRGVYYADRSPTVRSHSKAGIRRDSASDGTNWPNRFYYWMDRISIVSILIALAWWWFG